MGSLSFAEIMVIVVVILVVFGPKRLPELSRRAGQLLAKVREGTSYVTQALDSEYGEHMEPIRDLKQQYDGLKGDVGRAVSGLADLDSPPPDKQDDAGDATGSDEAASADQ